MILLEHDAPRPDDADIMAEFAGDPPVSIVATQEVPASLGVEIALADPTATDGFTRSQWFWARLGSGALIMFCYPQDEAYLAGEDVREV